MSQIAIRVLLIDDEAGYLSQLEGQLQAARFRTFIASELEDSLAQARLAHFDLAVISVPLQDLKNIDLLKLIRRVNSAIHLPLLCLEPNLDHDKTIVALELGADMVLDRNTPLAVLIPHMLALANTKRRQDELLKDMDQLKKALAHHQDELETLRRNNAQLRELSLTDSLTRTFNLRYVEQWLSQALAALHRHHRPLSLILIDIDHFKWINDQFGHPAGDYALKELAVLLRTCVRDADVVARYGGDEFMLVLPDTSPRQAKKLADRIFKQLRTAQLLPHNNHRHAKITCSMGCTTVPDDKYIDCFDDLLEAADQALYAAKRDGRNCFRPYSQLAPQLRNPDSATIPAAPQSKI